MKNLELIFNEEKGVWEEKPEPYITVEIDTKEEYEWLKEAIAFYQNREKYKKAVPGEWSTIEDDYVGMTALQCSECNQEYWFEDEPPIKIYNYCPNCGAKMDGDRNDI